MRTIIFGLNAVLLLCLFTNFSFSMVPVLTIMELFKISDFVGMITVEQIEINGKEKLAIAKVRDVWKGPQMTSVKYQAYPTWRCDTSDAIKGESGLIFLIKEGQSYHITNSGRGRYNLDYYLSRITENHVVMYRFSEYDLMTEEKLSKLSNSGLREKESKFRELSLLELKLLLLSNVATRPNNSFERTTPATRSVLLRALN